LPEYFVELIHKINEKYFCEFHLLGSADAIDISKYITDNTNKNNIEITNHSGETSILDVVRILDKSNVLISNDTGILHLGTARKIPVVAIYGSTTTEFGFTPYRTPHTICEVELKCRPCSHIGRKKCSRKHFNCMRLLYPEIVFSNFENLLF
jgi:heptosyltransferase-2